MPQRARGLGRVPVASEKLRDQSLVQPQKHRPLAGRKVPVIEIDLEHEDSPPDDDHESVEKKDSMIVHGAIVHKDDIDIDREELAPHKVH